jgi:hypothetical protein
MISTVPPGYTARYHLLPAFSDTVTTAYRLPAAQRHPEFAHKIDLSSLTLHEPFRLLRGLGTDWLSLQMGQPLSTDVAGTLDIPLPSSLFPLPSSLNVCLSVVPMWPVSCGRSTRLAVSVDGGEPVVCENHFREWSSEWKLQVLANRKDFVLSLPLDPRRRQHVLTLTIIDPGQLIQKITYQ